MLPWLVRHAAFVLSPMAPIGETVDFKVVRGDVAKLKPLCLCGHLPGIHGRE